MNFIKKIPQFKIRLIMTIVGVLLCSFAVGFFQNSGFGVDPFQCLSMGVFGKFFSKLTEYGTYYVVLSIIMLVAVLLLDKHYIGIATLINLFLTGYIISFASGIIGGLVPKPGMAVRVVFLLIGVVIMCFASSLYMTSDLGVSVYDALAIIISNKTKFPFKFCRIATDVICVSIGFVCGKIPGIGTLITAFFMGPLVDFFNRKFSRPLLEKHK